MYLWDLDKGFAGCFLIKKSESCAVCVLCVLCVLGLGMLGLGVFPD